MVVVSQCARAFASLDVPQLDGLVHRPTGHNGSIRVDANNTYPLVVVTVGARTVSRRNIPHLDGLVTGSRQDLVSRREEDDGRHVVVVAVQSLDALSMLKVPELDRKISTARGEHRPVLVKGNILHSIRVPLEGAFVGTTLVIPNLHDRVFSSGNTNTVDGMELDNGDGHAVARQRVLGGLAGKGLRLVHPLALSKRREVFLKGRHLGFQLHNL